MIKKPAQRYLYLHRIICTFLASNDTDTSFPTPISIFSISRFVTHACSTTPPQYASVKVSLHADWDDCAVRMRFMFILLDYIIYIQRIGGYM